MIMVRQCRITREQHTRAQSGKQSEKILVHAGLPPEPLLKWWTQDSNYEVLQQTLFSTRFWGQIYKSKCCQALST